MLKQKESQILIGSLLLGVGAVMFFKSTRISSWGFYSLGGVSTGGILIALLLLDLILLFATQHKATKLLLPILAAMLVLSVILGTRLYFGGSVLDLFLILLPSAAGAGLLLRAFLKKRE
ncbi:MAG: hypothetical protein IKQ04_10420 [Oscillospiraceae bacterium]|nr:hypothetical protein [Oscillospiraceae bacterium]MBR7010262.1 hypothetical protein [Oscillospiraceae bacterium]